MADWKWVPTAQNVADKAIKWQKNQYMSSDNWWFIEPVFLKTTWEEWPVEVN